MVLLKARFDCSIYAIIGTIKIALTNTARKWVSAKNIIYTPFACILLLTSIRSEFDTNISIDDNMARNSKVMTLPDEPPSQKPMK